MPTFTSYICDECDEVHNSWNSYLRCRYVLHQMLGRYRCLKCGNEVVGTVTEWRRHKLDFCPKVIEAVVKKVMNLLLENVDIW